MKPHIVGVLFLCGPACTGYMVDPNGGGGGDQAFLTIVGDTNVQVDLGLTQTLMVRYHDGDGQPLAGSIEFLFQGDPRGSTLSSGAVPTNAEGLADVVLNAGEIDGTVFSILARTSDADPAEWRVALAGANLPEAAVPGTYLLDSQFDLVQGLPGALGTVVNTWVEMTDDPSDPATYFLDKIGGAADDILDPFRPFLDVFLNNRILYYAPGFVDTLVRVGDDFGQVAKRFGMISELTITEKGGGGLEASQQVRKLYWTIDGRRSEYTLAAMSLPADVHADHIGITYDSTGKLTIGDHTLGISYGQTLVFILNHLIIPEIEVGCESMGCILSRAIDCGDLGFDLADYLGLGVIEAYLLVEGCDEVMGNLGRDLEDAIRGIGSSEGTALAIHGDGRVSDSNGDGTVDTIRGGLWEGVMKLGPLFGMLSKPDQKFTGNRMAGTTPGTP